MAAAASGEKTESPFFASYDSMVKRYSPIKDYVIGGCLGSGANADVWEASSLKTGMAVAIKITKPSMDESGLRLVRREAEHMQNVMEVTRRHPSLLKLFGVYEYTGDAESVCIAVVTQLWSGGMLLDHIMSQPRRRLPELDASLSFAQMAEGLKAMHNPTPELHGSFVHCDIKIDNMLMQSKDAAAEGVGVPVALLADFGDTVWVPDQDEAGTPGVYRRSAFRGTAEYGAPEQLQKNADGMHWYSTATDIWALGAALFCALNGAFPFGRRKSRRPADRDAFARKVCEGKMNRFSSTVSAEARDLITKMMAADPASRPSAAEVLEHPWMARGRELTRFIADGNVVTVDMVGADRAPLPEGSVTARVALLREYACGMTPEGLTALVNKLHQMLGEDADLVASALTWIQFEELMHALGYKGLVLRRLFDVIGHPCDGNVDVIEVSRAIGIVVWPGSDRTELVHKMYCAHGETDITPAGLVSVIDSLVGSSEDKLALTRENLAFRLSEADVEGVGRVTLEQLAAVAKCDPYIIKLMMLPLPNIGRFRRLLQPDNSIRVPPGMPTHAGDGFVASAWWREAVLAHATPAESATVAAAAAESAAAAAADESAAAAE